MTGKRVEHLLAWCCRCVAAAPIRPYLHLSGWNWFLFCPLQTAQTAEWMCRTAPIKPTTSVKSLAFKTWTTSGKTSLKIYREIQIFLHTCGRQPSPLCVWQWHMLMLTPCGEELLQYLFVFVWMETLHVCVCVRQRGGWGGVGHNEMGGWAGPPTIKALNGQPEVPVSVWMREFSREVKVSGSLMGLYD